MFTVNLTYNIISWLLFLLFPCLGGGGGGKEKEEEEEEEEEVTEMLCEQVEVRAFGVLAQELAVRSSVDGKEEEEMRGELVNLVASCLNEKVRERPTFIEILNTMKGLSAPCNRSKV